MSEERAKKRRRARAGESDTPPCEDAVLKTCNLLFAPGQVVEARIIKKPKGKKKRPVILYGYFENWTSLAEAVSRYNGEWHIYATLNPVKAALVVVTNHLRRAGKTTTDKCILRRRWLFIDCDSVRATDTAATATEHNFALEKVWAIKAYFLELGFPEDSIIVCSSGNGGYVLVRIDLPNDAASTRLIKTCLATLAEKFNDAHVKVDPSVSNPGRIGRIIGTVNCKGDNTPSRPHRVSEILHAPSTIEIAPRPLLEKLAALAGPSKAKEKAESAADGPIPQGQRNGTLMRIGGSLRHKGADEEEILTVLLEVNRTRCKPPLPDDEVENIVVSVCRYEPGCADVTERIANAITVDYHFAQDEGEALHFYKDGRYVPRGVRLIKRLVKEVVKKLGVKWTTHGSKEVVRFISDDAPLLKDSPEGELNCLNGVVDLKTGVLRAHSPDDLTTFQLPVLYDTSATCPAWDRFVAAILPDEDPVIIHEMAADALTTNRDHQKAILLEGAGGNGKSILLSALAAFAGPDNVSHYSLHDFENNRFATSGLRGKRLNICADLPSTHLETSSVFKQITGGDFIHGEYKHGASFSFQPHVRLIFSANTAPRAKDATSAFFQRWMVIKFSQEFRGTKAERPGKELLAELTTEKELSGLLNLALAALPNLLKNGFTVSRRMREAGAEFRRTTDPLALWLDANTVDDPEAWVSRVDLLRAYNLDCDNAERGGMNATAFTPAVERLRPQARREQKTVGSKTGVRVWVGIGLIASDQHAKASDPTESPQSEAPTRGTRGEKHCKQSETTPVSEEGVGKGQGMKENGCSGDDPVNPVFEETL